MWFGRESEARGERDEPAPQEHDGLRAIYLEKRLVLSLVDA